MGYRKVVIGNWIKGPVTEWITKINDNYRIWLNFEVMNRLYFQFTYQISHELSHLYCFHNDYNFKVNNWLIESICEMSSLYFLDFLHKEWQINPPYPDWEDDAIHFFEYKKDVEEEHFSKLHINHSNELIPLIKKEYPISGQYDREKNLSVAIVLLKYFQNDYNYWQVLKYLPKCVDEINDSTTEGTFENSTVNFDKLIDMLPEELKYLGNNIKKLFID